MYVFCWHLCRDQEKFNALCVLDPYFSLLAGLFLFRVLLPKIPATFALSLWLVVVVILGYLFYRLLQRFSAKRK